MTKQEPGDTIMFKNLEIDERKLMAAFAGGMVALTGGFVAILSIIPNA